MTKRVRSSNSNINFIDFTNSTINFNLTQVEREYTIESSGDDRIVIVFISRFFNCIVPEILNKILNYMDIGDIIYLSMTSKKVEKSICETQRICNFTENLFNHIEYKKRIQEYPTFIELKKKSFSKLFMFNAVLSGLYFFISELIRNEDLFLNEKGVMVYSTRYGEEICHTSKSSHYRGHIPYFTDCIYAM